MRFPENRNEFRVVLAVVSAGALILARISLPFPDHVDVVRVIFWTGVTLGAASLSVRLPTGVVANITTAPILAAVFDPLLANPFAACWIALLGTIEVRDIRREIPWYGTLYNKSSSVLAAFAASLALAATRPAVAQDDPLGTTTVILIVGLAFITTNVFLAVVGVSARTSAPVTRIWAMAIRDSLFGGTAQVFIGWLMAEVGLRVGLWATLLFMVPLLLARYSFTKYAETRALFFGTVSALSQAIDAKDGFTRGHADRVSRIAGAIAREMGLSERHIEEIELAGMLHDIGKIGVEDQILMKPTRLDPHEQELMRRHPIYGASILEPSESLRPLVPLVLHHHENYDGSGYPEGRRGEDIPLGSRIIIVADAYEAMTSDRIYRKAIGHERAMDQLNRYKAIQFDPKVVLALANLIDKRGPAAFEVSEMPPINYETLAELRKRLTREPVPRDAHAG
ncbi:MAG: HD-GYP domain-containing protein [Chloroflexota bacterium]|nr:HD-GYP domain-containing protein [Chloroflexota bacterium]